MLPNASISISSGVSSFSSSTGHSSNALLTWTPPPWSNRFCTTICARPVTWEISFARFSSRAAATVMSPNASLSIFSASFLKQGLATGKSFHSSQRFLKLTASRITHLFLPSKRRTPRPTCCTTTRGLNVGRNITKRSMSFTLTPSEKRSIVNKTYGLFTLAPPPEKSWKIFADAWPLFERKSKDFPFIFWSSPWKILINLSRRSATGGRKMTTLRDWLSAICFIISFAKLFTSAGTFVRTPHTSPKITPA